MDRETLLKCKSKIESTIESLRKVESFGYESKVMDRENILSMMTNLNDNSRTLSEAIQRLSYN